MKIQKRLWIALVTFGLFAIVFSTWIYNQSTSREKLSFDGTVTFEATQEVEGEIKTENMVLPEEFNGQRSLLFKPRIQLWRFFLTVKKFTSMAEMKMHLNF